MLEIYKTVEDLFMKLTGSSDYQNFPLHLAKILTGDDRVIHIFDKLIDFKLMPTITRVKKNSLHSARFRTDGNNFYTNNKFEEALWLYSKAIRFAQNASQELAFAYGNRSAVLFSMKNYEASIRDIKRAFDHGYPDSLKKKLEIRLQSSQKLLKPLSDEELQLRNECEDKFRLTKSPNKAIPCATSSVAIKYTLEMGRHVIATELLSPGDVISAEKPYVAALSQEYYSSHCYNCLTQIDDMIPCKSCCQVMFCSENCRDESWSLSHKYECPIMEYSSEPTNDISIALKIVLKAFHEYGDWTKLREAIRERELCTDNLYKGFTKTTQLHDDVATEEYVLDSGSYLAIHTLQTNLEKHSLKRIFVNCVQSAILIYLLSSHTNILSGVNKDPFREFDLRKFLGNLLFHHCDIAWTNRLDIFKVPISRSDLREKLYPIGFGIYAFTSMLNHSCAPNVFKCDKDTLSTMVVVCPIEAGSQVHHSYMMTYEDNYVLERQKVLEMFYGFRCQCEACTGNWPMFMFQPNKFPLSKEQKKILNRNKIPETKIQSLTQADRKTGLMIFKKLCAIIKALDQKRPNSALTVHIVLLKISLNLFLTKFPLRN